MKEPDAGVTKPADVDHSRLHGFLASLASACLTTGTLVKRGLRTISSAGVEAEDVAKFLDTLAERVTSLRSTLTPLDDLQDTYHKKAESQALELEADFREACKGRGWRVDGQWPAIIVERGVNVEIDTRKR